MSGVPNPYPYQRQGRRSPWGYNCNGNGNGDGNGSNDAREQSVTMMAGPPFKKPRLSDATGGSPYPLNPSQAFYKTRPCTQFSQTGSCSRGAYCTYAHGDADLHQPHPNWQLLSNPANNKICDLYFTRGSCKFGVSCKFLHQAPPELLRTQPAVAETPAVPPPNANVGGADRPGAGAWPHPKYPDLRKTKPCFEWERTGQCRSGAFCPYAHGPQGLRRLPVEGRMDLGYTNVEASLRDLPSLPTTTDVPESIPETTDRNESVQQEGFRNWKNFEKIIGIYADWIDELPIRSRSSPANNVN